MLLQMTTILFIRRLEYCYFCITQSRQSTILTIFTRASSYYFSAS